MRTVELQLTMARTITTPKGERIALATVRRLIAESRKPVIEQPVLFELRTDARPMGERNAAERYAAPSLFTYNEKERYFGANAKRWTCVRSAVIPTCCGR